MSSEVRIRDRHVGDIGWSLMRQAELYAWEHGYAQVFETYVAQGVPGFLERFDGAKDGMWIAEQDGRRLGCIAVQHTDEGAQLRWFFVEEGARGLGIGSALLAHALDFCRRAGYAHVFLWTCSDLEAAARRYGDVGFVCTETAPCPWKESVVQERWDLALTP